MRRLFLGSVTCIFLVACASTGKPLEPPLDTTHKLLIKNSFETIPNGLHVDSQNGLRVPDGNLDRWKTWCRLRVFNHLHGADYVSAIKPGLVEISSLRMDFASSNNLVPGHGHFNHFPWGFHDVPDYYLFTIHMRLTSPDQPDIRSLVCQRKWGNPGSAGYPTLTDIRRALGDQIEILPGSDEALSGLRQHHEISYAIPSNAVNLRAWNSTT